MDKCVVYSEPFLNLSIHFMTLKSRLNPIVVSVHSPIWSAFVVILLTMDKVCLDILKISMTFRKRNPTLTN